MEKRKVVLADIAKRVGLHVSSVSLALRGSEKISSSTRKRVEEVAAEMGYRPDPELVSLVSYRKRSHVNRPTSAIAVIMDRRSEIVMEESDHISQILGAIQERSKELGYNINIFTAGIDFNTSENLEMILDTRKIKGIIFLTIIDIATTIKLNWDKYTCVKIDQFPKNLNVDTVSADNMESVRIAVSKLISMGYKRPALVVNTEDESHINNLYTCGFLQAQVDLKPENRIEPHYFSRMDDDSLNQEVYNWMQQVQPDAIISEWNSLINCAKKQTLLGRHCRFVSLAIQREAQGCCGTKQNNEEIGRVAIEQITSKIRTNKLGIPKASSTILVQPEWVDVKKWPPK